MMITFSVFFFSAIFSPPGVYYFTLYSSSRESRRQFLDDRLELLGAAAAAVDRQALLLPAMDGVAELEEGEDSGRDRHPERDEAEDQDRREDRLLGDPEEDEGADQTRVDRSDPGRCQREEIGHHSEEVALDDHGERHVDAEGVEAGPEDADAESPEARGAEHGEASSRGMGEEAEGEAETLAQGRRDPGGFLEKLVGAVAVGEEGQPLLEVGWDQHDEDAEDQQQPGDRGGDDRQLHRALAVHHPGPQQDPEDDQRE